MKKMLVVAVILCTAAAFAGGPCHGRHHRRGCDGVRLAAGITGIVANGIGILNAAVIPGTAYSPAVGAPSRRYGERLVPVERTVLVPVQENGRIVYHREHRIVYVNQW